MMKILITLLLSFQVQALPCGPEIDALLASGPSSITKATAELFKQLANSSDDAFVRVKIVYKSEGSHHPEPSFVNVTAPSLANFISKVATQPQVEAVVGAKLDQLERTSNVLPQDALTYLRNLKAMDRYYFQQLNTGRLSQILLHVQLRESSKMSEFREQITKLGITAESLDLKPEVLNRNDRRGLDLTVTQQNLPFVLEALRAYAVSTLAVISTHQLTR